MQLESRYRLVLAVSAVSLPFAELMGKRLDWTHGQAGVRTYAPGKASAAAKALYHTLPVGRSPLVASVSRIAIHIMSDNQPASSSYEDFEATQKKKESQ